MLVEQTGTHSPKYEYGLHAGTTTTAIDSGRAVHHIPAVRSTVKPPVTQEMFTTTTPSRISSASTSEMTSTPARLLARPSVADSRRDIGRSVGASFIHNTDTRIVAKLTKADDEDADVNAPAA